MADLAQFSNEAFLSLETFRKNGVGVRTPIWFAQEGDPLQMWTMADSGKVKRIRNNPQVQKLEDLIHEETKRHEDFCFPLETSCLFVDHV